MPTLSVVMIVKNEQSNLQRLLPTLSFATEIVICDTGSSDDTVAVAQSCGAKVCCFDWCDDFAAARNFAIDNACGEYVMWLDADDFLPIRTVNFITDLMHTPSNMCADVYFIRYVCGKHKSVWFYRERILRNCPSCRFVGFIHEAVPAFGQTRTIDCEVVHLGATDHSSRNLDIYRKAIAQGRKFTPRDKYYYARTLADCSLSDEAFAVFRRCACDKQLDVRCRADSLLYLAKYHLCTGNLPFAQKTLYRVLSFYPPCPQVCCMFGEIASATKNYILASMWYKSATRAEFYGGFVDTAFADFVPYMQLAVCFWNMGDKQQAKFYFLQAKALRPDDPAVKADEKYFVD